MGDAADTLVCAPPDPQAAPRGFGVIISGDLPELVLVLAVGIALELCVDLHTQKLLRRSARKG